MSKTNLTATERAALAAVYLMGSDATVNGRRPAVATYRALARKGLYGTGGLTQEGRAIGKAEADEQTYRTVCPIGSRVEWIEIDTVSSRGRTGAVVDHRGSMLIVESDGQRAEVPASDVLIAL